MRYLLTCLTPLLVGDGDRLSAIDYMVWKDQVNVLDQRRIFKLLSRGPRLDGYLSQLKKADKLDFAQWGGFAQNFAGRRIPFEHAAYSAYWNRAAGESLNIPTFAAGTSGPYLPGTAIKGALRTGVLFAGLNPALLRDLTGRFQGERPPRRPAEITEDQVIGRGGHDRMRQIAAGDSQPVAESVFQIYLLRVAALQGRGAAGWKQVRTTVNRAEDSTPWFAEMAKPGIAFEGAWSEKHGGARERVFQAANDYSARLLELHAQYAAAAGLEVLGRNVAELKAKLSEARDAGACVLSMGWGGGLLSKTAWLDLESEDRRTVLRSVALYSRALGSGAPFPKTRRVVFLQDKPATLPGWARLDVA